MNYYQARPKMKDGVDMDRARSGDWGDDDVEGWHFTCMNDGAIWPIGRCRDHGLHATKEEAEHCFYDGELTDGRVRLGTMDGQQLRCERCEAWTQQIVDVGHHLFQSLVLCETCVPDEDAARRVAGELRPFGGGIMIVSSW